MSVGNQTSKPDLDSRAGAIAGSFQRAFSDAATLQSYLAATPEADLVALGYTPDDIATLKTAFSDLAQLGAIWIGDDALPEAKDFRVFVRRLWGIGTY
jgi:hypothetical protein